MNASWDEADAIIRLLGLEPHPEGGHYRETFRDARTSTTGRAHSTAIYYLLRAGEQSRWHRIDAAEIWHWYAGDALEVRLVAPDGAKETRVLGCALDMGERPQCVVHAQYWQCARPRGRYALIGCTVAPGFDFERFELAPENWRPE